MGGDAVIPPSLFGGKFVANLLQKQFVSEYTQSIIAGTGTPTIVKNDTTQEVTITIPAGTTGRAFLSMDAITFKAGHTYSLDLELVDYVAPAATGDFFISRLAAPTLEFGTVQLAITGLTADSRQAVIFQPLTTDQAITFRIGFGIGGNVTATGVDAKAVIKNIKFEDLSVSGSNIPNEYVAPRQSALVLSDYQGSLTTAISGKLTLTKNIRSAEKGLSIAIFGDSYVNDSTEYPEQLKLLTQPKIGVWYQSQISLGVTTAGTRPSVFLVPFQTKMQRLIDMGQASMFALLQSSLNTVNGTTLATQDAAIATDLAAIKAAAQWAIANGITPILTTMAAWKTGAGANWITNSVYLAQQKWDNAINGLASELGVSIFSLRHGIEDAAIPYQIAAAYDSGDGTHTNSAGGTVIAANLKTLILALKSKVDMR